MKNLPFIIIFILFSLTCSAQPAALSEHNFYVPQNIQEANEQLDKILTSRAKAKFESLTERDFENIRSLFILGEWGIGEWEGEENAKSRFVQYLNQYVKSQPETWGYMGWQVRRHLVLLAYLRHLKNQSFDLVAESNRLNAKGDSVARLEELKSQRNLVADSIDGIYIPKNLQDCFVQLNKLLPDTIRLQLKRPDPMYGHAQFHMGLGRWMRNNWGLWGGSRLQQYFVELGIQHPDHMSGVILKSYSEYLNGRTVNEDAIISSNQSDIEKAEPASPPPPPPPLATDIKSKEKKYYSKEYRRFLRKRTIDDFDSLPPEA